MHMQHRRRLSPFCLINVSHVGGVHSYRLSTHATTILTGTHSDVLSPYPPPIDACHTFQIGMAPTCITPL